MYGGWRRLETRKGVNQMKGKRGEEKEKEKMSGRIWDNNEMTWQRREVGE